MYLNGLGGGHVPNPNGGVVAAGDDGVLGGMVDHPVHLLAVSLEDGHHLLQVLVEDGGVLIRAAGPDLRRVPGEHVKRQDA